MVVLIVMPLVLALIAALLPSNRSRITVLISAAVFHLIFVCNYWIAPPSEQFQGYLALDALGLLVLSVISVLFTLISLYLSGYLRMSKKPNRIFIICFLVFLSAMTLVTMSQHMGLLWIALEATTLFSATLINFHKTKEGIEATWKCLLLCSVGIALALLGTFFLAVSAINIKTLLLKDLFQQASLFYEPWFKMSVIFLFVGYGTKLGLAPMHSWKPDAYGEAPSPVGGLMSGALTSCAFLAILRVVQMCHHAGQTEFLQSMLLVVGLFSMGIAAIFILHQVDFNRMLGYSSIEHMGILVLGLSFGKTGIYGSLFHMVNNGLSKGLIFLVAGCLYRRYGTKKINNISGVLSSSPVLGFLLICGFLAVAGFPPFGTFTSELMILNAALIQKNYVAAFLYILFLAVIFIGMANIVLKMVHGHKRDKEESLKEDPRMIIPMMVFLVLIVFLGIYVPDFVEQALQKAAYSLGAE